MTSEFFVTPVMGPFPDKVKVVIAEMIGEKGIGIRDFFEKARAITSLKYVGKDPMSLLEY